MSIFCSFDHPLHCILDVNIVCNFLITLVTSYFGVTEASRPVTFDPPLHAPWSCPLVCLQAGNRVWCWPAGGGVSGLPTVRSPAHEEDDTLKLFSHAGASQISDKKMLGFFGDFDISLTFKKKSLNSF